MDLLSLFVRVGVNARQVPHLIARISRSMCHLLVSTLLKGRHGEDVIANPVRAPITRLYNLAKHPTVL